MKKISKTKIANIVYSSIITVPGVAGLAKYDEVTHLDNSNNTIILTKNYSQFINMHEEDNTYEIDVYIILLEGVNIRYVSQEVQIRIKYELEKMSISFYKEIKVNVNVYDLAI